MFEVRHRHAEHASRPLIVGVTGGMAAGKSLVTRMFAALGTPTWDADSAAKRLYQTDATLQQATLDRWGPRIAKLDEDGRMVDVDRKSLAEVVFSNPDELTWLEAQVHPAVGRAFSSWLDTQASAPLVIREAAILFESGSDATCDVTITVEAPEALRIRRARDRARQRGQAVPSESEVQARLARQWTEAQRVSRADHMLRNGAKDALLPQVLAIWALLTQESH
jgi:dephospho-CoA kinase